MSLFCPTKERATAIFTERANLRVIGDRWSGRRGLDFGRRQPGVECGVSSRCNYRLLLVVAEGGKYLALAVV